MSASTPLQCKVEGRNIRGFNQQVWNDQAKQLCGPGIEARFLNLLKMIGCENYWLVLELTYWLKPVTTISGAQENPYSTIDCTDQNKWATPGQPGILGDLLMSIRDRLNDTIPSSPLMGS